MKNITVKPTLANDKLKFSEHHIPSLQAGVYHITVKQSLKINKNESSDTCFDTSKDFAVLGERFSIKLTEISSVFPPPNHKGSFTNVLPHICVNRSTLPWERTVTKAGQDQTQTRAVPWMALLLFTEQEMKSIEEQQITLADIHQPSSSPHWPGFEQDIADKMTDRVVVVDIPTKILRSVMPTGRALCYQSHVRFIEDENGKVLTIQKPDGNIEADENAFIVGNRLPTKEGGKSYVYLVSLEGRFTGNSIDDLSFDFNGANAEDSTRLVSLHSWAFESDSKHFSSFFTDITEDTYHLPQCNNVDADQRLIQGSVPLKHHFRNGDKSISWYHGPFLTGSTADNEVKNDVVKNADELLRYDKKIAMFDVSYAAAWQLGRLLCLADKGFSQTLSEWKKKNILHKFQNQQIQALQNHPLKTLSSANSTKEDPIPVEIVSWFSELLHLKKVPYNYLIPDEQLLPNNSIRFFQVDPVWLRYLAEGACSIGGEMNGEFSLSNIGQKPSIMSGLLLRSEVVEKFHLRVDAYATNVDQSNKSGKDEPLQLLEARKLSKDTTLYIFKGTLKMADFYLSLEKIHFGFDFCDNNYCKQLRQANGEFNKKPPNVQLSFLGSDQTNTIVDIKKLFNDMKCKLNDEKFSSASFAMQMIEGSWVYRYLTDVNQ